MITHPNTKERPDELKIELSLAEVYCAKSMMEKQPENLSANAIGTLGAIRLGLDTMSRKAPWPTHTGYMTKHLIPQLQHLLLMAEYTIDPQSVIQRIRNNAQTILYRQAVNSDSDARNELFK